MAKQLEAQGIEFDYIHRLKKRAAPLFKIKQRLQKVFTGHRDSFSYYPPSLQYYAQQVAEQLAHTNAQAVIAPLLAPIAYLDCAQPIIFWTDALPTSLLHFYPGSRRLTDASIQQMHAITEETLHRTRLAIFSSDWAARYALERYGVQPEKIKVVPFGANIDRQHSLADIKQIIKNRDKRVIKLLFLGKDWFRKGGDIVLNVAKALASTGQAVELAIVGCKPPLDDLPAFVKCYGFISKQTAEGRAQIEKLLRDSHFLFMPSRAEAYGIVFCEANAFGLPCLTSFVGGIATVIKNNINGMTFSLESSVTTYCDYITHLMQHPTDYENLALSSFHEYETRLNWGVATGTVKKLIEDII